LAGFDPSFKFGERVYNLISRQVNNVAMSAKVEAMGEASSPPVNTVDAANLKKEPPPETADSILSRRLILLSFWAVAIFLGLPIWWKTTTVYRAPLPLQPMLDWADGKVGRVGSV
jgi:phosphatidylinositol glycan class S